MISSFSRKQKRDPKKYILIIILGIFILFIVVVLAVADIKIYQKKQNYLSQVEDLKNKIQELEDKKSSLQQNIESSNNEDYIEKIAREELDLQKPGENVVSFIKPIDNQPKHDENDNILQLWLAGVSNFWNYLFK